MTEINRNYLAERSGPQIASLLSHSSAETNRLIGYGEHSRLCAARGPSSQCWGVLWHSASATHSWLVVVQTQRDKKHWVNNLLNWKARTMHHVLFLYDTTSFLTTFAKKRRWLLSCLSLHPGVPILQLVSSSHISSSTYQQIWTEFSRGTVFSSVFSSVCYSWQRSDHLLVLSVRERQERVVKVSSAGPLSSMRVLAAQGVGACFCLAVRMCCPLTKSWA